MVGGEVSALLLVIWQFLLDTITTAISLFGTNLSCIQVLPSEVSHTDQGSHPWHLLALHHQYHLLSSTGQNQSADTKSQDIIWQTETQGHYHSLKPEPIFLFLKTIRAWDQRPLIHNGTSKTLKHKECQKVQITISPFIHILSQLFNYLQPLHTEMGTAVAQWLRCCATNQNVAGSIPACVSGFFIDKKSFRSHYCPWVDSASNRNEYQEYFLGVKAAGA